MAKAKAIAVVAILTSLVSLTGAGFAAASSHTCIDHDDCFRHSYGEDALDLPFRGDSAPNTGMESGNATGRADADAVDERSGAFEGCGLGCRHE